MEEKELETNIKKSIKKNYIYNVIYRVFAIIVPLIVTPYVSRVLTAEGVGQYSYAYSLITYFTLFGAFGFEQYARREIAKYQNDKHSQSKIFWEIVLCRFVSVGISLAINLILCFSHIYGSYEALMYIFSINIIATGFDIAFLFQGNEDFGKIVIRNVIIKLLSVIAIYIFVKDTGDVWVYTLISAIMLIVSNLSLWTYLPKTLIKVSVKIIKPFRHLKGALRLFIPTIATTIYTVLDKTLINALINDTYIVIENGVEVVKNYSDLENGYYEQSEKIVKMLLTVITCIGTVMAPRNSNEIAKGNYEQVQRNTYKCAKFVWLIGIPLVFGLCATASNFVPWFFGDGYDKCITLIITLSPLILIIGFSNVFGIQYLVPKGKDTYYAIVLICAAFINLILNLILIPYYWSIGAAIGTLIAEIVVTLMMLIAIRKEISFLKILISGWKIIISGLAMFVIVYFTSKYLDSSILNFIILVIEGVVAYGIMILLLREKLVLEYLNIGINFIKKKLNREKK